MRRSALLTCTCLLLAEISLGATINFGNATLNGSDVLFFRSDGSDLISGQVELFAGTAPTDVGEAMSLTNPIDVIPILFGVNTMGGGIFLSAMNVPNADGALTGLDLFVVISDEARRMFAVIDIAAELGTETPVAPFSVNEPLNDPTLITLQGPGSGFRPDLDFSSLGVGPHPGYALRLVPNPEPSAAILAGLGALCLLRRRR